MTKKQGPHDVARHFFQSLMQHQFHVAWHLFSDHSQKSFIAWTLKGIYDRNPKAAEAAKLGAPEVKLMFETNNIDLVLSFWKHFMRQSNAMYFNRFGYFNTGETTGKQAIVNVRLDYENGKQDHINLTMVYDRNSWRFGYLESNLPF